MKKTISLLIFSFLFVGSLFLGSLETVQADWWERPTARPTQPSQDRDLPTPTQQTVPTQPVSQPTVTLPPGGGVPTSAPSNGGGGGGSTVDDPCASGKSYTGPYCGWSPEKDKPASTGGGGEARIGQPSVLGLSYTGSGDLKASDIILLTGVLCLLLYLRSKLPKIKSI